MSLLPPEELLSHILQECDYLMDATKSMDMSLFAQDETAKRAFVRSLEIVGEATKRLKSSFREKHSHIDWRAIAGTRDKLIHGCEGVDYSLVWDMANVDIPKLAEDIQKIQGSG